MSKKEQATNGQSGAVAVIGKIASTSLVKNLATAANIEPERYVATVMKTAFKGSQAPSAEEFAAFMMVAGEYNLDPFMGQIFAFPSKGGIIPFLGVDGWISLINRQPKHRGLEVTEEEDSEGLPYKTTVKIYVEGYDQPVTISERYSECKRNTDPWKSHPFRMLRHKTIIQGGRVAYGLSGLYDQDEAERILVARGEMIDVTPPSVDAGQVVPLPADASKVVEPYSDVEVIDTDVHETPDEQGPEGGVEPPPATEEPAETSSQPEEPTSDGTLPLGEPSEEEQVKVKIFELADALDIKHTEVKRRVAALNPRSGISGLNQLRQEYLKALNELRNK